MVAVGVATSPLLVRVKADAKSVMLANEVNFGRCSIPITFRTLFHAFDISEFVHRLWLPLLMVKMNINSKN